MATLQDINAANIKAMKEKNSIAKALFSTFKGAIETELKNSKKEESVIIENLAKKFTENAKLMNNADSKEEIELLKPFLPSELEEREYARLAMDIINSNSKVIEEIKAGNKNKTGFLVGLFMKEAKIKFPGFSVNAELVKFSIDQALVAFA